MPVGLFDNLSFSTVPVSQTPIPGALPLFASALGLGGLVGYRRKRKAKMTTRSTGIRQLFQSVAVVVAIEITAICPAHAATVTFDFSDIDQRLYVGEVETSGIFRLHTAEGNVIGPGIKLRH